MLQSLNKTHKAIVIEDGTIIGGLSSTVKEIIANNKIEVDAKYYAYPDKFIEHGSIKDIEKKYNMDISQIEKTVLKMFENK